MSKNIIAPLFSIITVCLNDREGLIRTLGSIRAQTCTDYEWIVVDGASNDGTAQFLAHLPPGECQWVSERDQGLYDAMNKGIDRSSGEYLLFLNAGDELADADVLKMVAASVSADFPPQLIYGDAYEVTENGDMLLKLSRAHTWYWYGMFAHHQAMFYQRRSISQLRYGLRYKIGEDYAFTSSFLQSISRVKRLNLPICKFTQGGLSEKYAELGAQANFCIRRDVLGMGYLQNSVVYVAQTLTRYMRKYSPFIYGKLRFSKAIKRNKMPK